MSLTPKGLADVEAASKRERAHYNDHVKLGCPDPVCYCTRCIIDRETIAAAAPWLIAYVREAQEKAARALPPTDFGALDWPESPDEPCRSTDMGDLD